MGVERAARRTPVTPEQVFLSFATAWQMLAGQPPKRDVLHIIHAQSALETGHWKSLWNYNLGGSKKHGTCDWTHFTTTERFPHAAADKYLASSKPGAEVALVKVDATHKTLRFHGKQQMNCFASWEDLDTAARDHIALLFRRFPEAIEKAKAGDVDGYVRELKRKGYFTASEDEYKKAVGSIAKRYTRELAAVQMPAVVVL
jgi:flagellum-specific peptidoglycan hydrolase FlgJ